MTTPCLTCQAAIEPFLCFGKMPLANGFLMPEDFQGEFFFDLKVGFCENCSMVQLTEQVDRRRLFHEGYAYFSSISTRMATHFQHFAAAIRSEQLTSRDPFVVEIGSNDGILLRHFSDAGIRHLGIEPSANVAQAARQRGVQTVCEFFDEDLARRIVAEHGRADVLLGANVMCHIADLHGVIEGMSTLLKPDGVVVFEDPYLGDILEKTSYDQIYDEHVFYFSLSSLRHLFGSHGFELIDVAPQNVHGGSMRYTFARRGTRPVRAAVPAQQGKEAELGLMRRETFDVFRQRVERSRDELAALLGDVSRAGARVVGYGATSKSTTVTNYCGISPQLVEFICDTTPGKQGKYSPGVHLPVRLYEEFCKHYPDYALLFAWNHSEEIFAKEQKFRDAGGQWIVYVPEVKRLA